MTTEDVLAEHPLLAKAEQKSSIEPGAGQDQLFISRSRDWAQPHSIHSQETGQYSLSISHHHLEKGASYLWSLGMGSKD